MDRVPEADMPDVDRAAHAVSQEAIDAGVWVCGSGLEDQRGSIVAADGTVIDGPQVTVGGLTVIEVPHARRRTCGPPSGPQRAAATRKSGNSDTTPRSTRCSARLLADGHVLTRLPSVVKRAVLASWSVRRRLSPST
jgi:hypothetical protein